MSVDGARLICLADKFINALGASVLCSQLSALMHTSLVLQSSVSSVPSCEPASSTFNRPSRTRLHHLPDNQPPPGFTDHKVVVVVILSTTVASARPTSPCKALAYLTSPTVSKDPRLQLCFLLPTSSDFKGLGLAPPSQHYIITHIRCMNAGVTMLATVPTTGNWMIWTRD